MIIMRIVITLLMSVIFITSAVFGRQVPQPPIPVRIITGPNGEVITVPGGSDDEDEEQPRPKGIGPNIEKGAAKGKDGQPKEDPRLKKISQLQHDRRPSAILKAWSEPM